MQRALVCVAYIFAGIGTHIGDMFPYYFYVHFFFFGNKKLMNTPLIYFIFIFFL